MINPDQLGQQKTLGGALKQYLTEMGAEDAAKALGENEKNIKMIMAGKAVITPSLLTKFNRMIGGPIEKDVNLAAPGEDPKKPTPVIDVEDFEEVKDPMPDAETEDLIGDIPTTEEEEPVKPKKKVLVPAKNRVVIPKKAAPAPTKAIVVNNGAKPAVETKYLPEFNGRDLCVLFPCYKTTNPVTAMALVALALDFTIEKIRFEMDLGDADITHSRNKLARKFLESEAQWAFWLDDDVIPPIGRPGWLKTLGNLPNTYPDSIAGEHVIKRLMSHQKTFVGATYYGRRPDGPPMFGEAMSDKNARVAARNYSNELRATAWVGTGCLLVHRNVFLAIQKQFPELHRKAADGSMIWGFFDKVEADEAGEDVQFCRRAKAAGHQPYVDLGCQALHVGYMVYGAHNTKNDVSGLLL